LKAVGRFLFGGVWEMVVVGAQAEAYATKRKSGWWPLFLLKVDGEN